MDSMTNFTNLFLLYTMDVCCDSNLSLRSLRTGCGQSVSMVTIEGYLGVMQSYKRGSFDIHIYIVVLKMSRQT